MFFRDIIGNEELKMQLAKMVDENRLGHAILFREDQGSGALAFALALAQYVNCRNRHDGEPCGECPSCYKYNKLIHPDLHFAFPVSASTLLSDAEKKAPISDYFINQWRQMVLENPYFTEQELYDNIGIENKSGNIGVNEAKRIFEKLSLCASEADYKVVIVYLPEKMNQEASNKLLKLLEEPPVGTLFLLVSQAVEKLLPTIRSRCQLINLKPLTKEERAAVSAPVLPEDYLELMDNLLSASKSKSLVNTFPVWEALADLGREKQKEFCMYAESFIRKMFLTSRNLQQISVIADKESAVINRYIGSVKADFYQKAFGYLEFALRSIDANVNSKLLFCDLTNRFFLAF